MWVQTRLCVSELSRRTTAARTRVTGGARRFWEDIPAAETVGFQMVLLGAATHPCMHPHWTGRAVLVWRCRFPLAFSCLSECTLNLKLRTEVCVCTERRCTEFGVFWRCVGRWGDLFLLRVRPNLLRTRAI